MYPRCIDFSSRSPLLCKNVWRIGLFIKWTRKDNSKTREYNIVSVQVFASSRLQTLFLFSMIDRIELHICLARIERGGLKLLFKSSRWYRAFFASSECIWTLFFSKYFDNKKRSRRQKCDNNKKIVYIFSCNMYAHRLYHLLNFSTK